ncbi:MAG: ATP synthase F1 subunit epsilon [Lachnospiraceae bacterium]|nr:ATP synthase F1 subunit epsilon [Lachnospiraceae bacterium]
MADESRLFKLKVISPDRIFFDGEADMIEVKTTEGEMGIYKNHIPLTAILAPGVLKIKNGGEERQAALLDGFIEILGDKVTILAEACEWPEEIDLNRAEEARIRAERRLKSANGEINETRAEMALRRSLIRIELAQKGQK